jgi:hypothetical protein
LDGAKLPVNPSKRRTQGADSHWRRLSTGVAGLIIVEAGYGAAFAVGVEKFWARTGKL